MHSRITRSVSAPAAYFQCALMTGASAGRSVSSRHSLSAGRPSGLAHAAHCALADSPSGPQSVPAGTAASRARHAAASSCHVRHGSRQFTARPAASSRRRSAGSAASVTPWKVTLGAAAAGAPRAGASHAPPASHTPDATSSTSYTPSRGARNRGATCRVRGSCVNTATLRGPVATSRPASAAVNDNPVTRGAWLMSGCSAPAALAHRATAAHTPSPPSSAMIGTAVVDAAAGSAIRNVIWARLTRQPNHHKHDTASKWPLYIIAVSAAGEGC